MAYKCQGQFFLELEEFSNLLTRAMEWSIFESPMMCDKEIWTLSEAEKKRSESKFERFGVLCRT
jgi:hypothetical protein